MASPTAAEIAGLLIENQSAVLGYILACVRNHSDAEDVFQEVAIAAVQLCDQLDDRVGFLPWVRQIARLLAQPVRGLNAERWFQWIC